MTSEQFKSLLQELAHVARGDAAELVEHGRVQIGNLKALLAHDPAYEAELLQIRMLLGNMPTQEQELIAKALLEANYVSGYGGECVFSLMPDTDDVVLTLKYRLHDALTPQDLWQELSDIAENGGRMWEAILASAQPLAEAPAQMPSLLMGQAAV